jgi:transketolase
VTLIGTGLVLAEVMQAADLLASQGIDATVIEIHTLKPILQAEIIREAALRTGRVVTIEEHNVIGGTGTVVAEILAGTGLVKIKKLGLQDTFAESGTPDELLRKYRLKSDCIVEEVKELF